MIRHPRYKVGRRLGPGVYEKCQTPKFAESLERRRAPKGRGDRSKSDYGIAMLEKQRARVTYGVSERQFKRYISEAISKKGANQQEILYQVLERRLDNVVYRVGLAPTRAASRQMVSHGHILLNGKKITVPSHSVSDGDVVAIRSGSVKSTLFNDAEKKLTDSIAPKWLRIDSSKKEIKAVGLPVLEVGRAGLNFAGILDFYKR